MGHIGLTPVDPSARRTPGPGQDARSRRRLLSDALAVQQAGAFAVAVELVPSNSPPPYRAIAHSTIGIGAGAGCSGEVQVITDLLGMSAEFTPKHARHYAELHSIIKSAAEAYQADVIARTFPGPEQSTRMDDATLDEILGRTALDRPEMVETSRGIPLDRDL